MNVLLSTAYWPNLHYFWYVLNASSVLIEEHEHYEKQSYRNRCTILSANGPLNLSLPVHRAHNKSTTGTILLSADTPWRQQHWHAIRSAYGKSPYFEYFADELSAMYDESFERLIDFNTAQLRLILKILRIKKDIQFSESYIEKTTDVDLRKTIHPKIGFPEDERVLAVLSQKYYQTFSSRYDFISNLSLLDLLFNLGLESRDYLLNTKV